VCAHRTYIKALLHASTSIINNHSKNNFPRKENISTGGTEDCYAKGIRVKKEGPGTVIYSQTLNYFTSFMEKCRASVGFLASCGYNYKYIFC